MDFFDRLLDHDHWATTQILELSNDLTDAQLDQEFDVGHRTLRATLDHMIIVIGFWTDLMAGRTITSDPRTQDRDRSIAGLTERHERLHAEFASLARRMRDEQRLDDTFNDHYNLPTSFGGTIIQIPQHNIEHRTETAHMLQRLGASEVVEVDHLLWEHIMQGH